MTAKEENSIEYLEKFGYRNYPGGRVDRKHRTFNLMRFEVFSTWDRSTFGKILLIITIIVNLFSVIGATTIVNDADILGSFTEEQLKNALNRFVAMYLAIGDSPVVLPGIGEQFFGFSINIGILLVALFGIAGSGMFADDKEGNVIEIYLSKLRKREYVFGKIGAILVYTNLFIMLPILVVGYLYANSLGFDHFEIIGYYLGIIGYSLAVTLILGLGILTLSILFEKRQYASLGFFLIYLLGSIFGGLIFTINQSNELLLLLSPETFLILLGYVCVGDTDLALRGDFGSSATVLNLSDGSGLENYHVLLLALLYIVSLSIIITYKIRKLSTEEL